MSTQEHHTTVSGLGFTVTNDDLALVNAYPGDWVLTGEGELPENWWAVDLDGRGWPFTGHGSPQQIYDAAVDSGLNCAYVAPYGRYVQGAEDAVRLHDWLRDRRHKQKHQRHSTV